MSAAKHSNVASDVPCPDRKACPVLTCVLRSDSKSNDFLMKQRSAKSTTLNETDLLDSNADAVGRLEGIFRGVALATYLFLFVRNFDSDF